jgi:multiple sugar transport system ATP-binding protein
VATGFYREVLRGKAASALIFLNRRDLVAAMAEILFEGVTKRYPGGHTAVRELNLAIGEGEFLVLVGPSGCGKSTALRMVAGLEDISAGRILIGGEVANDLSPRERNIAMVFQSYALYPHLTVEENIGFGLRVRGVAAAEIAAKVKATAEVLELDGLLARKPQQLSGGQRQRVAMGRAIVREPRAFLMDEPLSNLDARLRVQMRAEIARIQKITGVTTIYVTHDQVEAMTMGDRVAVLNHGVLQQLGTPRSLYHDPTNLFVASFIGSPAMNLLEARLTGGGRAELVLGPHRMPLPRALVDRKPGLFRYRDRTLIAGFRPEALSCLGVGTSGGLAGTVAFAEDLGATLLVHLDVDAPPPHLGADQVAEAEAEALVRQRSKARVRAVIDGRAPVKAGERLAIEIDAERLHLFDPATGAAIG